MIQIVVSIGVYEGSQSLLILKQDYLDIAEGMPGDSFQLNLWIYFGYKTVLFGLFTFLGFF
jgi:hypothetical protein